MKSKCFFLVFVVVVGAFLLGSFGCTKKVDVEKIVRIDVNQSYAGTQHISLPFKEWAVKTLDAAGFQSFYKEFEGGTLLIKAEGQSLSGIYAAFGLDFVPRETLYTGAIVTGTVTFETQGRTFTESFAETMNPPETTRNFSQSPDQAPFERVAEVPFKSALLEIVAAMRGTIEPVIAALRDNDAGVRMAAAQALGNIKDPLAVEPLMVALRDKDGGVRRLAAQALGEIGDPRAVRPLVRILRDEPWNGYMAEYSATVYSVLENVDPRWRETEEAKRTTSELIAILKSPYEDLHKVAAWALQRITGQDFGEDYWAWDTWWKENRRKSNQ